MTLSETFDLVVQKEKRSGHKLKTALSSQSGYRETNVQILQGSEVFYLPAVNAKVRIKWGRIFIEQIFNFFEIKLAGGLKGLSYIGMIEPGYYNVIYRDFGNQRKNVVSWHGHFLVWGINRKDLVTHLPRVKSRFTPIMPGLCAVHKKAIEPNQFGYKLWYIIKAPCKEYSTGKRRKPDPKTGLARFKQNSRELRPGHRVKLFYLMRNMYLDQLAMAGREGRELLRRIKYEAFREYRKKNGWHDRRP